jgi:hypothetical protein
MVHVPTVVVKRVDEFRSCYPRVGYRGCNIFPFCYQRAPGYTASRNRVDLAAIKAPDTELKTRRCDST